MIKTPIEVRPMQQADGDEIFGLVSVSDFKTWLETRKGKIALTALLEGRVVGVAFAQTMGDGWWELVKLAVGPNVSEPDGRKIEAELISALKSMCEQLYAAFPDQAMRQFLETVGFTADDPTGTAPRRGRGRHEAALLYWTRNPA